MSFSWITSFASVLGISLGLFAYILLSFYVRNVYGGAWGLISAIFAAACFHLHYLRSRHENNELSNWYSVGQLTGLAVLGFFGCLISLGFTIWYAVYAYHHAIPILPVEGSYYLTAVCSFMAFNWTFILSILSTRYARFIRRNP